LPFSFLANILAASIESLKAGVPTAQFLHKSIFQTGTTILKKKQIAHLRAFRMCIVKDSPEPELFNHPGALTKLALWIGEALAEQERDDTGRLAQGGRGTPLVVASLDEKRSVYVVVGTGGGGGPDSAFAGREALKSRREAREKKAKAREERRKTKAVIREEKRAAKRRDKEDEGDYGDGDGDGDGDETEESESEASSSDSDDDESSGDEDDSQRRGYGLNRFGTAFQDVVAETNARVRIDSFEHCVVEVKKEDLSGFLESLSMKSVVG
jgi:cell division control protein 45